MSAALPAGTQAIKSQSAGSEEVSFQSNTSTCFIYEPKKRHGITSSCVAVNVEGDGGMNDPIGTENEGRDGERFLYLMFQTEDKNDDRMGGKRDGVMSRVSEERESYDRKQLKRV